MDLCALERQYTLILPDSVPSQYIGTGKQLVGFPYIVTCSCRVSVRAMLETIHMSAVCLRPHLECHHNCPFPTSTPSLFSTFSTYLCTRSRNEALLTSSCCSLCSLAQMKVAQTKNGNFEVYTMGGVVAIFARVPGARQRGRVSCYCYGCRGRGQVT